jgi:hypothetical protein
VKTEHRPAGETAIDFVYFDFWHYEGRTAKYGAFTEWSGFPAMARQLFRKQL